MSSNHLLDLAIHLDHALLERREIERLTLNHPDLTLEDAYQIQEKGVQFRISRGERIVGYKMGLTSKAKQEQMNLRSPIYGVLTDRMQLNSGGCFSLKNSIHPKIEPEIAFLIDRDIHHPLNPTEAIEACSGVFAALEILDSRYMNFKYFSLPDVVADNSSSAYFILSEMKKPIQELDLPQLDMVMKVNGEVAQRSLSNSISGNPIYSVVQLSEILYSRGRSIPAGSIVLAGAATQAVQLTSGDRVELIVDQLGSVAISIE
jgi:2-oxo-3-hexenedioate decarboxylase